MAVDFRALRSEFPTLARWAHFDIARKAPLPRSVDRAMQEFMDDVHRTGGERVFAMNRIEKSRETVAQLLGAPPECLAFVKNTSEGINAVASGLSFSPGDKVLVTALEHSANVLPWRRLEWQGVGVVVETVPAPEGRLTVDEVIERIDDRTRVVAVSWVTYGSGLRLDLRKLGKACRQRSALLVVDAIQGVGVLDEPISGLGADVMAAGAHKGLLALNGTAILYCRQEALETLHPAYLARFSFAEDDKWAEPLALAPDAHRFEYGNPNFLGILVLERSAEFLAGIGLSAIEARVRALTGYLIDRAEDLDLEVVTPRPWYERAGIVTFAVPDPRAARSRLHERGILVAVKDGGLLRASCHFYNTEEEIDRLVEVAAGA